eukprot:6108899-Alexandrium_andersonii.AAC.1
MLAGGACKALASTARAPNVAMERPRTSSICDAEGVGPPSTVAWLGGGAPPSASRRLGSTPGADGATEAGAAAGGTAAAGGISC